jgi:hypothetical protein
VDTGIKASLTPPRKVATRELGLVEPGDTLAVVGTRSVVIELEALDETEVPIALSAVTVNE